MWQQQSHSALQAPMYDDSAGKSVWSGIIRGIAPACLVVVILAIAIGLAALARLVTASLTFDVQQLTTLIVVAVGLLAAACVYAVLCVRALRQVGRWQRAGAAARARGALIGLWLSALIMVLPLLAAALFPQHPAP